MASAPNPYILVNLPWPPPTLNPYEPTDPSAPETMDKVLLDFSSMYFIIS